MTEPNVLGNISPAKFLFDSGNTEIINLWKGDNSSGGALDYTSLHVQQAGTANGVVYSPAAGRVFYLLHFMADYVSATSEIELQSNTTADTNVGGTTETKINLYTASAGVSNSRVLCIKFVAGEYITPVLISGNDWFCTAWGVECDA